MEYKSYQHVEKLGTSPTEGILNGNCFIFPKIDGTNASVWLGDDGLIKAGSRNRELTIESDNAGFCKWVLEQENLKEFFKKYPNHRLYGEWLVPHTLKTYKSDAWRKFYVFDVCDSFGNHLHYFDYSFNILDGFEIEYLKPLANILNPSEEVIKQTLNTNTFLVEEGIGEGVVIKNYDFVNKFGRVVWAKVVTGEFMSQHKNKTHNFFKNNSLTIENEIAERFVTLVLVDKEYAKIYNGEGGWSGKQIPRLLETVYHCLLTEECYEFVKVFKQPVVDFKRLRNECYNVVKKIKPEIF